MADTTHGSLPASQHDLTGVRGIFAASFILILTTAAAAQLVGAPWRNWFPGAEGERSLIGGVKAATDCLIGHLI